MALRDLVGVRGRRRRELAVGVPAVHAVHPADRVAGPAGVLRVQGAGRGGSRDRRAAARRASPSPTPRLGPRRGVAHPPLLHSLVLAMATDLPGLVVGPGRRRPGGHNEERMRDLLDPVGLGGYLVSGDFWGRTLQNWQSELLAIGTMAVFAIYLRERGSPETKPVGAPHDETRSDD